MSSPIEYLFILIEYLSIIIVHGYLVTVIGMLFLGIYLIAKEMWRCFSSLK